MDSLYMRDSEEIESQVNGVQILNISHFIENIEKSLINVNTHKYILGNKRKEIDRYAESEYMHVCMKDDLLNLVRNPSIYSWEYSKFLNTFTPSEDRKPIDIFTHFMGSLESRFIESGLCFSRDLVIIPYSGGFEKEKILEFFEKTGSKCTELESFFTKSPNYFSLYKTRGFYHKPTVFNSCVRKASSALVVLIDKSEVYLSDFEGLKKGQIGDIMYFYKEVKFIG